MKPEAKAAARELRRSGESVKVIAKKLAVSPGSVSRWTKDIQLTEDQRADLLGRNNHWAANQARTRKKEERYREYHKQALDEWPSLSQDPKFMFDLALYVGEGGKTQPHTLALSNADPRVIRRMLTFFIRIGVPRDRLRLHIHVHDVAQVEPAEEHWLQVTGMSRQVLFKTSIAVSRASNRKKGSRKLPFGTAVIKATHTPTRRKIDVWMDQALAPVV